MTKTLRTIAIALVAILLVVSVASAAKPCSPNTDSALKSNKNLQNTMKRLVRSGYELHDINLQQIYYFVQPEGDYHWGTQQYVYIRTSDGYSLETDYAYVDAAVWAGDCGWWVPQVTVSYTTVY